MSEINTSRAERQEYRKRRWQSTPRPKWFPFSRLVISAILAFVQLAVSKLRHHWNPKVPVPDVNMATFLVIVVGIAVYMAIYILEWSWNYIEISPAILDKQRKEQIDTLEALARKRQNGIRIARLMEDASKLDTTIRMVQNNQELNSTVAPQLSAWIANVVTALTESGIPTDAAAFLHSGERPTAEQTKAVAMANFAPEWKQYYMTQLALYRAKLQEIVERRGI